MYVATSSTTPGQCGTPKGMGQVSFNPSDWTATWTWENYLLLGIGGLFAYKLFNSVGRKVSGAGRKRKSKQRKVADAKRTISESGGIGSEIPILLIILVGGGAALYFYSQSQQGATS